MTRRHPRSVAVALLTAAAAQSRLHVRQTGPDIVLSNEEIITVDERFTIAQALASRGDRIVAVAMR